VFKFSIPKWLKFREEVLIVKHMTDMSQVKDEEVWDVVSKIVARSDWRYFEEMLRRERDTRLKELILSDTQKEGDRIKGRIKTIDWLLQFNGFATKF